jgi:manganese transport protein
MLRYLGPAFIASVAYLDPGNYATNLEGGARYGYLLVWVVFASNAMAMVVQTLSAKLGIATGKNLAELCRDVYPRPLVWFLWGIMEIVAMATDLAEFLGAAVAFVLLFGMPMWLAGILVLFCTFALLAVERIGFRHFEAVITVFVGVIAACYLIEVLKASPAWDKVLANTIKPSFAGTNSVLLAAGILGATVMPHAIFLHSALTQNRIRPASEEHRRVIFRFEIIDVILAMGIAGLVNAAMLIVAARTFHERGLTNVNAIEDAYLTLQPLLGRAAGVLFAVSLLASGLSSSAVGTMAGQIIMQGFLRRHIPVWLRRLITVTPAMVAIMLGLEPTRLLVLSQVVLSFGLPFAIVPLVHFSMRRDLMGVLVNRISTTIIAWIIAMLIIALNLYLLYKTVTGS